MLFLYSAHISLKQRLKALYNIPPTDLVKPLPTQLPRKHTRSAATGAPSLSIQHLLAVHVPDTHFKYCWGDRGNRSQTPYPWV